MFNPAVISGPFSVPIYGAPEIDGDGLTYLPITGYQPGYHLVVPSYIVTADLAAHAADVPTGVPELSSQPSLLLTFDDQAAAEAALADYVGD